MKEALYYTKNKDGTVQCLLCPRKCKIQEGKIGFCNTRQVKNGKLYTLTYGKAIALHVDPIEKKPLFHFLPGTFVFSFGTLGCNLRCKYCQNWDISQSKSESFDGEDIPPKDIVRLAIENNCESIASTYNEPTVFFEYMLDIIKEAKKKDLKTVMVSNGFINQEPLKELLDYTDGFNIDLKAISSEFYKDLCAAWPEPILENLKIINKSKSWLEITNLIIPTMNDKPEEIKKLCKWIFENLGRDVPLHLTAFYPCYKLMNIPPTPKETLIKAYEIAKKIGLNYAYVGNVSADEMENTHCPSCKELLIERIGYKILSNKIKKGKCGFCKADIAGVFNN